MSEQLIDQVSKIRGIESNYVDAWGNPAQVVPESKAKLLSAMGYDVTNPEVLQQQVEAELITAWQTPLAKVKVVRLAKSQEIEVRLPIDMVNAEIKWTVLTEDGDKVEGFFTAVDGQLIGSETVDDSEFQAYIVTLELDLPLGYHSLSLKKKGGRKVLATMRLIVAPKSAYKPEAIEQGKKSWGPSVQLYCLRSERNWGVGDFTDLNYLVENIAKRGGDFVGLNPIHALYPSNPEAASPYSPSSRRWMNIIYIDVEAIEDFAKSEDAKSLVASDDFQSRLDQLRAVKDVDYTGVTQAKIEVLKLCFAQFQTIQKGRSARATAFKKFVKEGGDSLLQQASYDALQAYFYEQGQEAWGWPAWPEEFQEFHKADVATWIKDNQDRVNFYNYLQWLADEQLAIADAVAKDNNMALGLYRDLAVGVSEGSTEIWANGELYCRDAAVGAPPDVLGPLGQNWGLPPMDPAKLFEQEYQPIIDLFRSNMKSCGALRIDHVMALLRLWWVPAGSGAGEGSYVYYNVDDLLGLLALESHRNKCLIIGEDLGTVPEGIDVKLKENGVHSYRVFFFEQADDGGYIAPAHYPEQAMATLSTHDMATLKGFWHCDDLQLGKELGIYPDQNVLDGLYKSRLEDKQKILDSLHGLGSIGDNVGYDAMNVGMDKALNYGMHYHMAKGSSSLFCLQLEDWIEMDKPVNVPGTSDEYPNWRRKLSRNLADIFSDNDINSLTNTLTNARREASK